MTVSHGPADPEPSRRFARSVTRRRLLVALTVTGRAAAEIDGLRRALGGSGLGRIAPHITLVPPVNVRNVEIVDVLRLVRTVAADDPAEVRIGPAHTFAPRTPVVYLAVNGDTARIVELQRRLAAPPLVPAAPRVGRPFVPHITIGGRVERVKIVAALQVLANFELAAMLSTVALCEQDDQAPRHPWRVIADVILGSGSTVGRGGRELTFVGSTMLDLETAAWIAATPGEGGIGAQATTPPVEDPFVLTAYATDRPVGAVIGSASGKTLTVHTLRVDENRRNEGIGGQLVRALERAVAGRGGTRVTFDVVADGPVDGFLSHLGYRRAVLPVAARPDRPQVVLERLIG